MTIDSPDIIRTLIENNGVYPGDEDNPNGPVVRITEYTNSWGGRTWGVVYASEVRMGLADRYAESEYIYDPVIIFTREDLCTPSSASPSRSCSSSVSPSAPSPGRSPSHTQTHPA